MKTILLAAGSSSRMSPIGDKNFLSFSGKPLMLHLLENAQAAGSNDFIIVANAENQAQVELLCANHDFLKDAVIVVQTDLNEGMAGGVRAALPNIDDQAAGLVLNGNDYVLPAAIAQVIETGQRNDGALLGQVQEKYFPGGYLQVDGENRIKSIIEKPGAGNEPSNLVNIVVHYFSKMGELKSALDGARSDQDDVYEVALDQLFQTKNFKAVHYKGPWQAIKYPWHVLDMMNIIMSNQETQISQAAEISDRAIIKGDRIVVASGAKIFENAVICGPCYIGENVVIGNGALVRHAYIGKNSVIGYNTEIARSWLNSNVTTHIAYIGDSVIDSGVNFGAYSCTANLRLDQKSVGVCVKDKKIDSGHQKLGAIVGKNVQIGVGAKLMPGSKVDKNTAIRPNEVWF